MADSNTFLARIKQKYDTYAEWIKNDPVLLAGEPAFVVVPGSSDVVEQEPAILLKVGDGAKKFSELPFLSGLAANVHTWALQATKPTYAASEITGLSDYISGQIQDTDTQYQLVRVSDTSFKLQSKPKNGGAWTDVGDPINITYTLEEGTGNGTLKFNGADVKVHGLGSAAFTDAGAYDAAGAADSAKAEVLGVSGDASTKNTIYGAKKYADEKANAAKTGAVNDAKGYTDTTVGAAKSELIGDDVGVTASTIKGGVAEAKTYADTQIAAKMASAYKAAGSVAFSGLPQLAATEEGKVYNITDDFTTDANFVDGAGKKHSAGTNVVCIDVGGKVYKWDVLAGMVDLSSYDTAAVAASKVATAKQEAIEAAEADATTKANAAETNAKGHADTLNTAMSERMDAVETDKHTHANKALLDTYKQTEANLADAVAKKHEHVNKTVLDGINAGKVAEWDAKANDADLAKIAKSGKVSDLIQDPGTYVIFDCGSSSVNI